MHFIVQNSALLFTKQCPAWGFFLNIWGGAHAPHAPIEEFPMDLGEHLAFYYGDFLVLKVRLRNKYTIIMLKPSFLTQIDSQIQYIKSLIVS